MLSVEPFIDNIYRFHKSAKLEGTESNIVLLQNALSDKRNEVKLLGYRSSDIGGQSLMGNKNKTFKKLDPNNKYLVETILLDDIVPYLPKRDDGNAFEQAFMKIDIEGFEPYAFTNARLLFDTLDIQVIFMEWANLINHKDARSLVLEMLNFLLFRDFKPYHPQLNQLLSPHDIDNWPFDIHWYKQKL